MAGDTDLSDGADDADPHLRPQSIREMIGQRVVCERLQLAVDAAIQGGATLAHILLDGRPGLGKTTFALCLAREIDVSMQLTSGIALQAPRDLIPYLTNASDRSILFIDEIDRLSKAVEEYLYTAMEDFRVDMVHGEGTNARTLNLWLKPFTLIGATTRAEMLSAPLRDRFQIREHLDIYSLGELKAIVFRNAAKLGVEIDERSATEIASRSRGTPRVANNHLRWVRDYVTSRGYGKIFYSLTLAALRLLDIDRPGFDHEDG